MKLALVFVALSVALLAALGYQAVRQELGMRDMKTRMVDSATEAKRKEQNIIEVKLEIQEVRRKLTEAHTTKDELTKRKTEAETSAQELDKSVSRCNSEKDDAAKKKTNLSDAMNKLKADHEEERKKVEEVILSLKQQILDRDKAICTFADTTKEEARKLCGIAETTK